ncbi:SLAC1 anion channel family protein [Pseudomonadota bacterium]
MKISNKISTVPSTLFGSVMGITGLALAWRRAEEYFGWSTLPGDTFAVIASITLLVLIITYTLKVILFRSSYLEDLNHPVRGPFIAGLPLAILLQVPFIKPFSEPVAHAVFAVGASFSIGFNLYLFARWYLRSYDIESYNAVWLIPGVGSFIVALIGAPLGYIELSWFFFSIGICFWVFLSAILMYRYIFCGPTPEILRPSFFIPIVPPALMSMIYPLLDGGEISNFARIIYYFALFLTLFNFSMIGIFLKLKFNLGWWAYSFPLDTITSATLFYAKTTSNNFLMGVGQILLVLTTVVISGLIVLTANTVVRGRL